MQWIVDGEHEWLEVPIERIYQEGLTENDFSSYSRQGGDYFYLESDYDASIFFHAIGYEISDHRLDEIPVQNYTGRCFVSHLPCLRTTRSIKRTQQSDKFFKSVS